MHVQLGQFFWVARTNPEGNEFLFEAGIFSPIRKRDKFFKKSKSNMVSTNEKRNSGKVNFKVQCCEKILFSANNVNLFESNKCYEL